MGLYLCVFRDDDGDDEIEGVEVGGYDDFHAFREMVAAVCEDGHRGSRFPILMSASDSEGAWTPTQAAGLDRELDAIARLLSGRAPRPYDADTWQAKEMARLGMKPLNLADSFIDVDGEPLLNRLRTLAKASVEVGRAIEFL